jgi:hypothetical protein
MNCEGAIYKSAGSRSVQAEHKKRRPLVPDSTLRSIREDEEIRRRGEAEQRHCIRASDMEGQFQVPASLCSNPFPCSCSYREASRNWASGKSYSIPRMFCQGFCWWWLAPDRDSVVIAEILLFWSKPGEMGLGIPPYIFEKAAIWFGLRPGWRLSARDELRFDLSLSISWFPS